MERPLAAYNQKQALNAAIQSGLLGRSPPSPDAAWEAYGNGQAADGTSFKAAYRRRLSRGSAANSSSGGGKASGAGLAMLLRAGDAASGGERESRTPRPAGDVFEWTGHSGDEGQGPDAKRMRADRGAVKTGPGAAAPPKPAANAHIRRRNFAPASKAAAEAEGGKGVRPTDAAGQAALDRIAQSQVDGRKESQFKVGNRGSAAPAETSIAGRAIASTDKKASRTAPATNDAKNSAMAFEAEQWAAAHVHAAIQLEQRWEEAQQPRAKKSRPKMKPKASSGKAAVKRSPTSAANARSGTYKVQLWDAIVDETREKFDACNWAGVGRGATKDKGRFKTCPVRKLSLQAMERHIKDNGAECPPNRPGRRSQLPPALGPAVEATLKVGQHEGLTGGLHKRDVLEMFKAAIKGSPFEELFDTSEKFETLYSTWLRTEAGALSRAMPTVGAEQDVNRLRWMKASILVLQYGGMFRELMRLGFMDPDTELLPAGSAGADISKYAELGLNYSQGTWKPGALDMITFCDERDVTPTYTPRKGGHNIQIFATKTKVSLEAALADMVRMQASQKGIMKVTGCGAFTGSAKVLPDAYYFASTAKACPEVFIPECQLLRGCGVAAPGACGQCECQWYGPDQKHIVRSDMRCLALGLAAKIDPAVRGSALDGRTVCKPVVVEPDSEGGTGSEEESGGNMVFGRITSYCSAEATTAGVQKVPVRKPGNEADWWEVEWAVAAGDESGGTAHIQHYSWEDLVPMLVERDAHLDAGDEAEALAIGRTIGRTIKPDWVRDLPVATVNMDGRDKKLHCKVCYNPSGGRTAVAWQRYKTAVFHEVHDECTIMSRGATISDGATGLISALNQVADVLNGRHGLPTAANASAAAQPSDDKSLHGHATNVEDAEVANILAEKRIGRKAGASGPALAADPTAKLAMTDFARIRRAGWTVMSDEPAMENALQKCGFVPASIAGERTATHSLLTAFALPSHCHSLPSHCLRTAFALPLTAFALPADPPACRPASCTVSLRIAFALPPHCLRTASALPSHCLACHSLPSHCLRTSQRWWRTRRYCGTWIQRRA